MDRELAESRTRPGPASGTVTTGRPTLAQSLVASFAGRAWTSVMWLAFVPLYVRLMGIESYGLVGVFLSLAALIAFLDLGLSSMLSRELALLSDSSASGAAGESRDLVRTLETLFWGTGLVIGAGLTALARPIAHHWISAAGLSERTVAQAIAIMGLVIAIQWPASLYDGGLTGLQRQVMLNGIRAVMATVQHAGAVVVLWLVSPSILAYFSWQIAVNVAQTLLLRWAVWRSLPPAASTRSFRGSLLRKHWRFAAGMTGISVTAIVLTQADKILLSKLLPLTSFGYYVVAFNLASVLIAAVSPIFPVVFPRFSQLLAGPDDASLSRLYHHTCQYVSAIVLPAAAILALFPEEILLLWTRSPAVVASSAPLARFLVVGSALNALVFVPYLVQVASGWTRLTFLSNVVAVITLVPLMLWTVGLHGAIGGAVTWAILNAGYMLVYIPIMHRRLLKHEMWRWYRIDVALPLVVVSGVAAAGRALLPPGRSQAFVLAWIATTGAAALIAASLVLPATRGWLRKWSAT